MDIPPLVYLTCSIDERLVKLQYRKKSLLVHPDKCSLQGAINCFDLLKKAQDALLDAGKQKMLLGFMMDARATVMQRLRIDIPTTTTGSNPFALPMANKDALKLQTNHPLLSSQILDETRRLMRDLQRRDQLKLQNDVERKLDAAEKQATDRKAESAELKTWEDTRDGRIDNWRQFKHSQGVQKKKKKKKEKMNEVVGALPF